MVRGVALAIAASIAIVGCYSPSLPIDQPCSETGHCPEDLTCDLASQTCVDSVPDVARFAQISTHSDHTCGIDHAGALWCWGLNTYGELGLDDTDLRIAPARVGVESDWTQISAGDEITCGIRGESNLWCWGYDLTGQGHHDTKPAQVPGAWSSIVVGENGYCAIGGGGKVSCRFIPEAELTDEGSPVVAAQIAATDRAVCAIDAQGALSCWGNNQTSQLGTGDALDVPAATPHKIAGTWKTVVMGGAHTCALSTDGGVSCWGACSYGQLGGNTDCQRPGRVDNEQYIAVGAGANHTCAVRADHELACFGSSDAGQVGGFTFRLTFDPTVIDGIGDWKSVAGGGRHTCGIRGNDEAWCWGINRQGQLGDGGGGIAHEPVAIGTDAWESVGMGRHTSCGIQMDHSLWCWGSNSFGQVGDGTKLERRRPVQIGSDHDWLAVAPSTFSVCGIRAPGSLWCWGDNDTHQLGNGGDAASLVPQRIGTSDGWTEVAMTDINACGILDGKLSCWGNNVGTVPQAQGKQFTSLQAHPGADFGALEGGRAWLWLDVTTTPDAPNVTNWTKLATGDGHACGLRGSELWCWGRNGSGQLGSDAPDGTLDAVREDSAASWIDVDAGDSATCGVRSDGALACWGINYLIAGGQSIEDAHAPAVVGSKTWLSVDVGEDDACGIQSDHTLHCWGLGDTSTRGDGRGGHERPARVSPPGAGK